MFAFRRRWFTAVHIAIPRNLLSQQTYIVFKTSGPGRCGNQLPVHDVRPTPHLRTYIVKLVYLETLYNRLKLLSFVSQPTFTDQRTHHSSYVRLCMSSRPLLGAPQKSQCATHVNLSQNLTSTHTIERWCSRQLGCSTVARQDQQPRHRLVPMQPV
jgi:hypothetical protein